MTIVLLLFSLSIPVLFLYADHLIMNIDPDSPLSKKSDDVDTILNSSNDSNSPYKKIN